MYLHKKTKQTKIAERITHQIPLLREIRVCWVFINIPLLPLFHHLLLSPQDLDGAHINRENSQFTASLMGTDVFTSVLISKTAPLSHRLETWEIMPQ